MWHESARPVRVHTLHLKPSCRGKSPHSLHLQNPFIFCNCAFNHKRAANHRSRPPFHLLDTHLRWNPLYVCALVCVYARGNNTHLCVPVVSTACLLLSERAGAWSSGTAAVRIECIFCSLQEVIVLRCVSAGSEVCSKADMLRHNRG